ncbi:MAG: NAD(P)H-binding protein, partial [Actinomycetota bacterium]|nr:NAD(P)H-binding protein [Actinomycetota bacterium]
MTGASGSVGREVLSALTQANVRVRALSRDQDTVAHWHQQGIDAALGSLEDLDGALDGCDRVFLLSAATPDQYGQDRMAIDSCRASGIDRVVKLSSGDAVPDSPISWARGHAYSDEYLKRSGLNYTLLKPSAFFPNLLSNASTIRRGFLPHTSKQGSTGWIDVADIAAS